MLYLYLSHGVTGVRVMSGAPDILAFRAAPHGPAPRMLIASPMLSGEPPIIPEPIVRVLETPEQAVEAVHAYADAGYDFIKIRENLTPAVLKAVIDTAAQRHLDVDGHLLDTDQLLVRTFSEQGVPLLAGTDALIPMIIPGESLHDELALLVEAGLSPYDGLRAATRTPAEIFARFDDLGIIAPGRAANLVLVSGNPLGDLAMLRRPNAVIIDGVYLDHATLDQHLEEIAVRFAAL